MVGLRLLRPAQRVGRRLGDRPDREAGRERPGDVRALEPGHVVAGRPQRQLGPRLDPAVEQEVLAHPDGPGVAPGRLATGVDDPAEREHPVGRDDVERAGDLAFQQVEGERRQIAGVDDLDRLIRRGRHEHVAALGDAAGPVGEPAGGVVRPDDQARPQDQGTVAERGPGGPLAPDLERPVALLGDLVLRRARRQLGNGGVLVRARTGVVGVHAAAGDEQVAPGRIREQPRRALDIGREVATHVDDDVEGAAAEAVEVPGAVADDPLDPGMEVGAGAAAVEEDELVVARKGELHQMPARERRATEDEYPHRASIRNRTVAPLKRGEAAPLAASQLSGRRDSNSGPHRPERCALPGCATPRGTPDYRTGGGPGRPLPRAAASRRAQ